MILVKDIAPGDKVRGTAGECRTCGVLFVGRDDAIYCGNTCRMSWTRKQEAQPSRDNAQNGNIPQP